MARASSSSSIGLKRGVVLLALICCFSLAEAQGTELIFYVKLWLIIDIYDRYDLIYT